MTAEIVLMNPMAVALAADSAVSVGVAKEYQSANKLFQLRVDQPVGIMIYGNAAFMGVPWELIIKEYRSARTGLDPLPTIEAYTTDFLEYVAQNPSLFPDGLENAVAAAEVASYFEFVLSEIYRKAVDERIAETGPIDDAVATELLLSTFQGQVEFVALQDSLETTQDGYLNLLDPLLDEVLPGAIESVFGDQAPDALLTPLRQLAYLILSKTYRIGPSGIVVAGFGVDEVFPSMREIHPQFVISKNMSFARGRSNDVNPFGNSAVVVPCAQRSAVDSFIGGIDLELQGEVAGSLEGVLNEFCEEVVKTVAVLPCSPPAAEVATVSAGCSEKAASLSQAFTEALNRRKHERYSGPILDAVEVLPKDELAGMAESLVNLTSLRQRVSLQRETVGGPIDVAIISRGDGFVWIKRKHYFPPELNPHFFTRYHV